MFSYYGAKSRIAKHYPHPEHDLIIEPFAGAGRYSLLHANHDVWLNDKYPVIADIWRYLIQATKQEIEDIPELEKGTDVRTIGVSDDVRRLLGFCVNNGVATPRNIYTGWAARSQRISQAKRTILRNLDRVRHWQVTCQDYLDLPNLKATWFIDPPYQNGGKVYAHNQIDYKQLADWCMSRRGQVIVCENDTADWMDFRPLTSMHGQRHEYIESIWTNGA